ncbi:Ecto-ADP-ribosyltransferase 4, partial [Clonorchis sinensis]
IRNSTSSRATCRTRILIMTSFDNVELRLFDESSFTCRTLGTILTLNVDSSKLVFFRQSEVLKEISLGSNVFISRVSLKVASVTVKKEKYAKAPTSYFVGFDSLKDILKFMSCVKSNDSDVSGAVVDLGVSSFDKRTDSWSAVQYFQFYSYLSQQQNMMQDFIRTSTYQRAILANSSVDFQGKVVLDVGAGSGILSFFAIHAGAARVYAVEASNMAGHCNTLVQANKLAGRIVVISGKIEEITLPEPVDIIISEPMGYMLYNERMLETYVHARKFLAPHLRQPIHSTKHSASRKPKVTNRIDHSDKMDGDQLSGDDDDDEDLDDFSNSTESDCFSNDELKQEGVDGELDTPEDDGVKRSNRAISSPGIMFPTVANLYIVPFFDEALFAEQCSKANFWYQQCFHGMDLTALRNAAMSEYFSQPVVDTFDIGLCPAVPCVHKVDFRTVSEGQLANIDIPVHFQISTSCTIHGLAFWFDVGFLGSQQEVWLSTSPTEPLTHWYQVRCLLGTPLFVQQGQALNGHVSMRANSRQSYDVQIELIVPGSQTRITNKLDLKNPHFRYNGYPPAPPPGSHTRSPTETYYANLCIQQQQQPLQVQTPQATTWTIPVGTAVGTSVPAGSLVVNATHTTSSVPSVGGNVVEQQSMQLSPQPLVPPASGHGILGPTPASGQQQQSSLAGAPSIESSCAAGLATGIFFNPANTALMTGVDDGSPGLIPIGHSTNGWRPGTFAIE